MILRRALWSMLVTLVAVSIIGRYVGIHSSGSSCQASLEHPLNYSGLLAYLIEQEPGACTLMRIDDSNAEGQYDKAEFYRDKIVLLADPDNANFQEVLARDMTRWEFPISHVDESTGCVRSERYWLLWRSRTESGMENFTSVEEVRLSAHFPEAWQIRTQLATACDTDRGIKLDGEFLVEILPTDSSYATLGSNSPAGRFSGYMLPPARLTFDMATY